MRAGAILSVGAALAAPLGASGCRADEPLELLVVHRLAPSRASAGDRVLVTGEGFPEGRSATVTFQGDLLRPGAAPERDVRIVLPPASADLTFDRATERRFVGSGEGALHTTFRGNVCVTFQPGALGSMPVSGAAHDVRFDVLPSGVDEASVAERPDQVRAAAFLGFSVTADPYGRGLDVGAIDADGRASAAGIRAGDLIVELDGATVLSEADLRVRGGQRSSRVLVERDGRPLPPLALDVEGLAPLGAADLAGAASIVLLGCAALGLPATRLGLVLRWLGRLAEGRRRRSQAMTPQPRLFARIVASLLPPATEGPGLAAVAIALLVVVVAAFVWLALGHSVVAPDGDLLALALGVAWRWDGALSFACCPPWAPSPARSSRAGAS